MTDEDKPARPDKADPADEAAFEMRMHLQRFLHTIDALQDFVEVISPHIQERDLNHADTPEGFIDALQLDPEDSERFRIIFETIEEKEQEQDSEPSRAKRERFKELMGEDLSPFVRFAEAYIRMTIRPAKRVILYRSAITMAVSAFEVMVAGIISQNFKLFPEALGVDKEFSLADLKRFENIGDAVEELAYRRVDSVMRQGFDDWARWFSKKLKIDFADVSPDWARTREIFERRHAIVHHDGRVSRQYLERIAPENLELGQVLDLDEEYVQAALDNLTAVGTPLCVQAWAKLVPSKAEESVDELLQAVYSHLRGERWHVAVHLASLGKAMPASHWTETALLCNEWLCRKRLLGVSEIEAEVRGWDTTALRPMFSLVRFVLLDNLEEALELLPKAVETGEITVQQVDEWPILTDLRQHPLFAEWRSNL